MPPSHPAPAADPGSEPPWVGARRHGDAVLLARPSAQVLPQERVADERARLDGAVGARHDRLALPTDRHDLLAARVLARTAVATLVAGDPDAVHLSQHCPRCGGTSHGPPSASFGSVAVAVSWAHSDGLVAAAAAPAHLRVGVDVETGDGRGWPGTTAAERAGLETLAPQAQPAAFRRLWTVKEALLKAGLWGLDDLTSTPLPAGDGSAGLRWWAFAGPAAIALAVVDGADRPAVTSGDQR